MKFLHTSDWHLGRTLYDKKRYDEFEAFLIWLIKFISDQQIDALLVAGDIFDTTTPSNRSQELYYQFLSDVSKSCCRHIIIIGGNHDSPTFLDAPKKLLMALNVRVVGSKMEGPENEVCVLKDTNGIAEAIVCAVPFLRDRDIRMVEGDESIADKNQKLLAGIANHYSEVKTIAKTFQDEKRHIPTIGMGHLFTRDGKTTEGDGVRELYIGSLAHIDGNLISDGFDYLALGHLHIAQKVGATENVRYSGSPIPMGFGEADQIKRVVVVTVNEKDTFITEHTIPCFQKLIKLSGDIKKISNQLNELKVLNSNAWVEIEIFTQSIAADINAIFDKIIEDSKLEILRIKNKNIIDHALTSLADNETLETLDHTEVFERCLDLHKIQEPERSEIISVYNEAYTSMMQHDSNAQ